MSIKLPSRNLVSQQDSAMVERPDIPRSKFSGSWTRKTTFDAGYLVPFLVEEVLPGDHLKYDVTAFVRMATPLFPIMDSQRIDTFFFFVPNRLVWSNWALFMGEVPNPTTTLPTNTVPVVLFDNDLAVPCTIYDYMGLAVGNYSASANYNALPFRAYNLIYNQWFRDENLINSVTVLTADAVAGVNADPAATYVLKKRAKSHDYFTSALPWPQKFTAPTVALGGQAPIVGIGSTSAATGLAGTFYDVNTGASESYAVYTPDGGAALGADWGNVYADLSAATGVSINVLRQAFLVQQLLERDARGGTRYTEIVKSHFGVTSPDMRLQRPEYIGGGSTPLTTTPIAQTAPVSGVGVGNLGGATTAAGSHRASYASTEHGYIIGLINVRTELSYSQGVARHYRRQTRYDFYWPSLAGLGEQEIMRSEIYATGASVNDDAVFGYQERWHEYRTRTSEVTGYFRAKVASNIDQWIFAQEFTGPPTLGQTFIEDTPPMDRVLAAGSVATGLQYYGDIHIRREAVRPIPTFGTPVKLGRF